MKDYDNSKLKVSIASVNEDASRGADTVLRDEELYGARIADAASEIILSGCRVFLLSGPSGSGKTTSSLKLGQELSSRGKAAQVISLDDFFKNVRDYPETPDGKKDYESIYALDVDLINERLYDLVTTGHAVIPQFDFIFQRRKRETKDVSIGRDGIVIIEGIHALNPLLYDSISRSQVFRIYAGLCVEYYDNDERVISTRDVRIARRMIRDHYFRGHSIEKTLEMWDNMLRGELRWIRVFRHQADLLFDTSLTYEVCVYGKMLAEVFSDESEGGAFRPLFAEIVGRFSALARMDESLPPDNSMLREFLGGLIL